MRQFLSIVIPLLLPTALYFFYMTTVRGRAPTGSGGKSALADVPWTWLGFAGALLMVVTFAAFALFGGAEPGSEYRPPRLIDGKIQPGEFVE